MANPDPNADLKEKAARATAEAELAKAQAELIKAQRALADAQKADDPLVTASQLEKARLDAQKAAADSSKALSDSRKASDLAAAQAAIGTVSASGIAGDVTVKTDAGKGEATLLGALAISKAAAVVVAAVKAASPARIVIAQGTEQFANYRQFLLQHELISRIFTEADREAKRLEAEADTLGGAGGAGVAPPSIPLITGAGVALDAVAKLGSYFLSNYEAGGVGLTADAEQLIAAVAGRLVSSTVTVVLPNRSTPALDEFKTAIAAIAQLVEAADSFAVQLIAKATSTKAASETEPDATIKKAQQSAVKLYEQAASILRKAITRAEEFIAALAVADAKGVALLTKITQEKAYYAELDKANTYVLSLDVRAAAGGYYTKKNLWTFLAARMPFFVMGGAVVTYTLVAKDGIVKTTGLVPVHSGYAAVDQVQSLFGLPTVAAGPAAAAVTPAVQPATPSPVTPTPPPKKP